MRTLMIRCDRCHEVMAEDELKVDYVSGGYRGERYCSCPFCGNESMTYVRECARCGEWCEDTYGTSGSEMCDSCISEVAEVRTVIEYGENTEVETKVNGFFEYVFRTEINEILKAEFMKLPEFKQNEYMRDYVSTDKSEFADWYMH